jgi:hypothetical protein
MNRNRLKVAFAGGVFIAAASFIYTSATYTRKYNEVELAGNDMAAFSAHQGRQDYWQLLHANVNTGLVDPQDFKNVFNQLKARIASKSSSSLSFIEEGPDNVGGRTRAICVDKNNTNIIYAGSVSGGLFKSTNKGGTWSLELGFTQAVNNAGIGDAVMSITTMDMMENGKLYVGTGGAIVGEGGIAGGGSGSQGAAGIWEGVVQPSGEMVFTQLAGTENWDITRIVAHPTENKIFITGVNRGVTIYDGTTFTSASGVSGSQSDVRISSDGQLLVCGRSEVFISTNGGASFTSGASLVNGSNGRFAISHEKNSDGKYNIYASMANGSGGLNGVYMSPDSGTTWFLIGPGGSATFRPFGPNNQGWYDNIITAVKGRPNECILGGIDLWHWKLGTNLSNPSGQWTVVSQWNDSPYSPKYVHADQHEMTWDKDGNLYFGNDGGVFTFIPPFPDDVQYLAFKHLVKNYNTVQFYAMSAGPNGNMIAGAQDNGTQVNTHTGFTYMSTYQGIGGDGFDCEISQINGDAMIGSIYYTDLKRSDDAFGNPPGSDVSVPCPAGTAGVNCGSFNTKFTLQEIEFDANTKDSVDYVFSQDTTIANGATFNFTYPSQNFSIELNGSYTNTTGSPVTFDRNDKIRVPDYVQALFALSIPGRGVYVTRDIWKFGQSPEWWRVLGSETGFSGSATSLKFSKDGKYLYVGTSGGDVWRVDGLANTYSAEAADGVQLPSQIKDISNNVYSQPFNLDFINNTYFRNDDNSLIRFKLNKTLIRSGSGTVTDIAVDPNDPERVVITLGGFGLASNILRSESAATTSFSNTFSSINGSGGSSLPLMPTYSAIIDKNDPDKIYAGTLFGLFYTENGGTTWIENNEQIGRVPVFALRQDISNDPNFGGAIYLATHGRGMWSTNKFLSTEENVKIDDEQKIKSAISVYPNPTTDVLNLTYELANSSDVMVNIVSLEGKLIKSVNMGSKYIGKHRTNINVQELPKGLYVLQVKTATDSKVAKFIKQ